MTPWLQYLIAFVVGCHGFTTAIAMMVVKPETIALAPVPQD